MTTKVYTVVLAVVAALIVSADAAFIKEIVPKLGSVHGKTRVSILGEGFDIRGRSNDVYIGTSIYGVFCDPIPNECHEKRIVCLTDAYEPVGEMPLSVRSHGHVADCQVSGGCTFEYTLSRTPEVSTIHPQWLVAPGKLTVSGSRFSQGDVSVANFDFTMHLGDEERCDLNGKVSGSSFVCNVEPMRPGTLPVDVQMGAYGRANLLSDKVVHLFPSISGVSPAAGSIGGGQKVTVFGTSFSPELSDNFVKIHGAPCTVTKYDNDRIECVTSAHAETSAQIPAYEAGKVQLDWWYNLPGNYITKDLVGKVNYLFPTGSKIVDSVTSDDAPSCDNCAFQWTTYFTPDQSGEHVFSGTGDDNYELWLSEDESPVERQRDESESGNPADVLGFNPRRLMSGTYNVDSKGNATLEAGKRYWMRALLKEGGGSQYINFHVTLPNGTKTRINQHYVSHRADWKPPVEVVVRDTPALLDAACKTHGSCNYDYTTASTPTISGISTATINPGEKITISGSKFSTVGTKPATQGTCAKSGCGGGGCECKTVAECDKHETVCAWDTNSGTCAPKTAAVCDGWSTNRVLMNGEACEISQVSSSEIVCSVPQTAGGFHEAVVYVNGLGRAVGQAFVTVNAAVRKLAPASGSVNGMNTLAVIGSGFDVTLGVTSVSVGGNNCPLQSTSSFELQCTVPAGTAGAADVKVTTKKHLTVRKDDAYTYVENFARPGTTTVDARTQMYPTSGSTGGGTEVTIVLPSDKKVSVTGTKVVIGGVPCEVRFSLGREIVCVTGKTDAWGSVSGTLTYVDKHGATKTVDLPSFRYQRAVSWVGDQLQSPFGGHWNRIAFDTTTAPRQSISVAVEGQPCEAINYGTGSIDCLMKPQPKTLPTLPVLDSFNFNGDGNEFTNKLHRMDYTPNVKANADGSVTIPKGGYVNSKKHYARPFVFSARIKATKSLSDGGGAIPIRVLVKEPTLSYSGVRGIVAERTDGRMGFGIDSWTQRTSDKEFQGSLEGIGLDTSSFRTYRMEVWHNYIRFFVDNKQVFQYPWTGRKSGTVGVGFAGQDVIVDDFEIKSLAPRALQVNVSGVPLTSNHDVLYSNVQMIKVTKIKPTTVKGGQKITVSGSNLRHNSPLQIYALKSATEPITRNTLKICTGGDVQQNVLTDAWEMVCTADEDIPAGSYFFHPRNEHGVGETSFPATVAAQVTEITPKFGGSGGRRITVVGSGFKSSADVKVGGAACTPVAMNPSQIVCDVPASNDTSRSVTVEQDGSALACKTAANCKFSVNSTAGWAESIEPSSGGEGTTVTIHGHHFAKDDTDGAYVGETKANWCSWKSENEIRCNMARSLKTGAHSVRVWQSTGFLDGAELSFRYVTAATQSTPSSGSVNGGTELRIRGTNIPTATGATKVDSKTFTSAQDGWSSDKLHTCNAGTMLGRFSPEEIVSRTFSGLASHKAVRVSYKILSSNPEPQVSVDGKVYVLPYRTRIANSCGSSGDRNYMYEGSVVLPHTGATATVSFSNRRQWSGWWGLMSYRLDTIETIAQSVTVGGKACPIEQVDSENVYCKTPAGTGADAAVVLTIGSSTYCDGCKFSYDAASAPTATKATLVVPSAPTTAPEFGTVSYVSATIDGDSTTLRKTGSHNTWNGGAFAPRPINKADGDVVGIQFTVARANDIYMIGLAEAGKNEGQHYSDIAFAMYLNGGKLYSYENGRYVSHIGYVSDGEEVSVSYEKSCNCVKYKKGTTTLYTSGMTPKFPLTVDVSIHNVDSVIKNIQYIAPVAAADRIVIAGDAIVADSAASVSVTDKPCLAQFHTAGHVSCWVASGSVKTGDSISATINNKNGKGSVATVTVATVVEKLSHVAGSKHGGHRVTVTGGKFDSTTKVSIAGAGTCSIVSVSENAVVCTTPAVSADVENAAVTVSNGATQLGCISDIAIMASSTSTTCDHLVYSFADAKTPTISSVTPATGNSGASVTLTGTNFVSGSTISVGSGSCEVKTMSETSIECTLKLADAGDYQLTVDSASVGKSSAVGFKVGASISSLSTTAAGNLGDAKLVIHGAGFGGGASTQSISVKVGGTDLCSSIRRADASLTCMTAAGNFDGPVVVTVNGVSATSSANFAASAANLASVSSVSPTAGGAGAYLTISGQNLGEGKITVGTADCDVISVTATSAKCILGSSLSAGDHTVGVVTTARGTASSSTTFTAVMSIQSISPSMGPKQGGQVVTLLGSGFRAKADMKVTIGGVVCAISESNSGMIKCTSGEMVDADDHTVVVEYTDAAGSSTVGDVQYTYDTTLTATITSISPASGSSSGLELVTIAGSSFSTDTLANLVTIGGTACDVESVSAAGDSIVCRTRERVPGANLPVMVVVANQGAATNSATIFSYQLQIDAVEGGSDFSTEGGVAVTFTGKGFWAIPDAESWMHKKYELTVGGVACPIVSSTSTKMICNLGASPRDVVEMPTLVSEYPARPERKGVSVALKGNGISATVANTAVINFVASATATISSVSPSKTEVTQGASVTISGSGFAASGNKVNVGESVCDVTAESATSITCKINTGVIGRGFVQVTVPGKGKASTQQSCPAGQYLLCDGNCVSDSECVYDDWGMTNCAELTHLIVHDTFCHSNGGTDRVNKPFRTDANVKFALNCPMYSCEGKDCDQALFIGGHGGRVSTCGKDPNGFYLDFRASISSASPKLSSAGGGRRVTISGKSFGTNLNAIQAFVGTAMCVPLTVSDTEIVCETTAHALAAKLTLRVAVNGLEAQCDSCGDFGYTDTMTPTVTSIAPTGDAVTGREITITGTGFSATAADNIVSVGPTNCAVTAATATEIKCTTPNNKPATHAVNVRVANKGLASPAGSMRYRLRTDTMSARKGSTEGGATVVLGVTGADANTRVVFGDCETEFVSFTDNKITVITKACEGTISNKLVQGDATTTRGSKSYAFADANTPKVDAFTADGKTLTITISNHNSATQADLKVAAGDAECTITAFESNVITCTMPDTHAAGVYDVVVTVASLGAAKNTVVAEYKDYILEVKDISPVSGSRGGNQAVTINGKGFDVTAENNEVTIGTAACRVTSATATKIVCMTGVVAAEVAAAPVVTVNHPKVKKTAASGTGSVAYAYQDAKTPVVSSVTPNRGSTAGGTRLTIGGKLLSKSLVVKIDGVVCTQSEAEQQMTDSKNGDMMFCTTAAHKTMFEPKLLSVATASDGDAHNADSTYQYIDLWSRWTTWGNTPPPVEGDSAVISEGQTVMIDYSPPRFHLIIVMGHLLLDDTKDIELDCTYIMINFGRFTVGTPQKPFHKKVTITLHGDRLTPEIPVHGSKVIALRHGALDVHGTPRQKTWTTVTATVPAGASTMKISGPVDWRAGEFIVIASTDYNPLHAEERRIIGVIPADGQADVVELQLEHPFDHEHYGERQCFDEGTKCIDEVAEVGLLTRNVVIQGDKHTDRLGFGGTMFLMPLGESEDRYARLSYFEFRNGGQQFIVGRYPLHFHVTGSSNTSYANGTAIHHSLNRAFSVHGVNNNTYVNNVAYDTHGHSLFIEDGSEMYNVITDNFICVSRVSTSNLNTDLTPANYWLVSPSNYVARNRAGGSMAYGYWIAPFHPHSTGPTFSTSICPASHKLWGFHDNVAHSNKKYGVNIFQFWWPKERECDFSGPDAPARLYNIVSYKNQIWGITLGNHEVGEVGAVTFDNLTSADNGMVHPDASNFWIEHIKAANQTCGLQNSVLIALTNNKPFNRRKHRRGVNLPLGDNFFTENVTFINYDNENFGFEPQAWAARLSLCFPWGWEAVSRGLRWVNSPNRIRFRFHHHGTLTDDDGTLSGVAGAQIVPHAPMFDDTICTTPTGFNTLSASLVCPNHYKIRRLGISSMNELFTDQGWTVDGRFEIVPEILRAYLVTAPINKMYTVDHQWWYTAAEWDWKYGSTRYNRPDERALFRVLYNGTRHHVYGTFDGKLNKTWNGSFPTLDDENSGYAFNDTTMEFRALLALPTRKLVANAFNCPDEGCPLPPLPPPAWEKPCGSFSDPKSWASGEVPADDSDVMVPYTDNLCIGRFESTPVPTSCDANKQMVYNFKQLRVEGGFQFTNDNCPCVGGEVIINVEHYVWVRNGGIVIGNETNPIKDCRIKFVLAMPPLNSEDPQNLVPYKLNPWGIRSFTLESGTIAMHGRKPEPAYTHLAASASASSTQLVLEEPVNWQVGDMVAIAGTNREQMYVKGRARNVENNNEHSEHHEIAAISEDKKTITLKTPLAHSHIGQAPTTLNGKTYSIGAEVALISRHISITGGHDGDVKPEFFAGWRLNVGCTPDNFEGCALGKRDGDIGWPMEAGKPGFLKLDSILLRDIGQGGVLHGALQLDGLTDGRENAKNSYIRNIAMWRVYNTGISIRHSTTGMTIENNLIYDVIGDGIRTAVAGNIIKNNLVMAVGVPEPNCEDVHFIFEDCRTSAYRLHAGTFATGNIAASGVGAGFSTTGINCDLPLRWADNVAHSQRDGLLTYKTNSDPGWRFSTSDSTYPKNGCRKIGGVMSYWNADHGLVVWYADGNLEVENYISVDNAIGSFAMTLHSSRFQDYLPTTKYTNVVYAGYFDGQSCRNSDYHYKCTSSLLNSKNWCTYFHGDAPFIGNVGMMETLFTTDSYGIGKTKGEQKFRWTEMDSYATVSGRAIIDGVHFANFNGQNECDLKDAAFYQNPFSNDTFHQHTFEKVTWGPGMKNGGELQTRRTYGEKNGHFYLDFDDTSYGAYWPDSPNKIWLTDVDGSFTKTGKMGSILSSETITRNTQFKDMRYDGRAFQAGGLPGVRDGCAWKAEWNAFQCDESKKWVHIGIDSLADDELTRRAAPVVLCKGDGMIEVNGDPICQGGVVDYVSGPVMKGKTQRATLDRMSRWRFIAEDKGNYTLAFRGQPPTHLRLTLQSHDYLGQGNDVGLTLNLRYFGLNSASRVGVYVNGKRQRPNVGYDYPYKMQPAQSWPAPTDALGTHFHDKFVDSSIQRETGQGLQRNVFSFSLRPTGVLELKQEPIVQVNMQVSMPEEEFFNNKETFAAAMASTLGISADRIKFAKIVAGTTRRRAGETTSVTMEIDMDPAKAEAEYNSGAEAETDFSDVVAKLEKVQNTAVGGVPIATVESSVMKVRDPRPPITVLEGTPYIAMNVTKANTVFNTSKMQELTHNWVLANLASLGAPYNVTSLSEVAISNVYTDKDTKWTQLAIVLAYENNNHTKVAMDEMYRQLEDSTASLFPGWDVRDLVYKLNGWVPEGYDPNAKQDGVDNETLIKFVIGLVIGVVVVFLVGGSIMYYFVSVRPRKLAREARQRKMAVHEVGGHEPSALEEKTPAPVDVVSHEPDATQNGQEMSSVSNTTGPFSPNESRVVSTTAVKIDEDL